MPIFAQKAWKGESQAFASPDIQKKQVHFTGDNTAVMVGKNVQSDEIIFSNFDGTSFDTPTALPGTSSSEVFSSKNDSGEIALLAQSSFGSSLFTFNNSTFNLAGQLPTFFSLSEVKNFKLMSSGNAVAILKMFDSQSNKDRLFAAFGPVNNTFLWQLSLPLDDANFDLLSSFNVQLEVNEQDNTVSAAFKLKDNAGNDRLFAKTSFDNGGNWLGGPVDVGVGSVLTYRLAQDGKGLIFGQQGTDGVFHTFFSNRISLFFPGVIVDADDGSNTIGAELQKVQGTETYIGINFNITTEAFNAITIIGGQRVSEQPLVPGGNNEFISNFNVNSQGEGVAVSVAVNNGQEVINAYNFENNTFLPAEVIANPQEATTGGIAIDINDIGDIIAMFGQTTTSPTFNCYREQEEDDGLDVEVKENDGSIVTTEHPNHNQPINTSTCIQYAMAETGDSANCGCTKCDCPTPATAVSPQPFSNDDPNEGDPIMLNSLDYIANMRLITIAGRGLDYEFNITYRSRVSFHGRIGHNWSDNHSIRIVPEDGGNSVVLYSGKLRGDRYEIVNDQFVAPDYHFNRMVEDDDNFILWRERDGKIYRFFPLDGSSKEGLLESITTPCGNKITHSYTAEGVIEFSLDSLSRKIEYTTDEIGHITKIKDFTGREVILAYENDELVSVRTPVVTGTNFNDFPNGKTWKFTYSSGFQDERLNHNMLTMTFPKEVENNGPSRIINSYNADDEIITQELGGTNDSGVAVGGTITYARELVSANAQNSNEVKERTTVTDRNGNITVYSYNNLGLMIKKEEKTRGIRANDPASFTTLYEYNDLQLLTKITRPEGNTIQYIYNSGSADPFQKGNLLSVISTPDVTRGGDQNVIRVDYEYEPVYNKLLKVTSARGLDPQYQPQNGGANSADRYTTEYIPDYFEADLDTAGCACGFTLQDLIDKFGVDITSVANRINAGDLNGDGRVDNICGLTIIVRQPNVKIRSGSPQAAIEGSTTQVIETRMAFNKFGQYNFVETPEGEVTTFSYFTEADPDGDGADILSGNANDGQPFDAATGGYLKEMITDDSHSARYRGNASPTQIKTQFSYDRLGNRTSVIDGRGIKHTMTYNQLNQLVEATRAADVSGSTEQNLTAFAYKSRALYDANNNVVETQVEIRDDNNTNLPNFLPTKMKYDILDNLVELEETISSSETRITQIRRDANENVTLTKSPEAVNGNQPGNTITCVYDERDILFTKTSAPGTADERTFTFNVDKNGNIVQTIDAEDNNGDSSGDVTTIVYDGFDRVKRTIDAVGNESIVTYDPDSNVVLTEMFGPIGGASRTTNSTVGNVLLAKSEMLYDEISRAFQTDTHLFMASGVNTVRPLALNDNDANSGDGKVTSFVDYDRNSRVTFTTSASPQGAEEVTSVEYDGAQRRIKVTDAENNQQLIEYDDNSNPIRVTKIDVNPTNRIANETFVTINVFDSLNRLQRTTDNIGQTSYFTYSSRNLLIRTADAQGPEIADPLGLFAGNINDEGNISETKYDGLGRAFENVRELRVDGEGGNPLDLSNPSNADGKITEITTFDQNSRVINVSDDNGNTTTYEYDNLNRLVATTFADGTQKTTVFDKDSNVIQTTDNNGSVCNYTFDAINRVVQKDITRAQNIEGSTQQTFEFDGLSRLTKATDNNDPSDTNDNSTVERKYDSLSRLVEEQQNDKVISMNWREISDLANCIYPNNRVIEYTQDKLNRLKTIGDQGQNPIATYDYIGNRVLERVYKNNTRLTMLNDDGDTDVGYDNLPRLAQMRHLKNDTNELITGYAYGYNRTNFKLHKVNLKNPQLSELYDLDSLYRVVDFKRGTLAAGNDGINDAPTQTQDWQLDGVGNWANTTVDGNSQTQSVNNMNEYNSFAGVSFTHDDNGNLTDDGERLFTYDALNRIIKVNRKSDNKLIASYKYDFANRRISKEFEREEQGSGGGTSGEYTTDSDTVALYHYNETSGKKVIDSSGNNNNGKAPRKAKHDVEGLFDTKAIKLKAFPVLVKPSQSLNSGSDQLTGETFVFIDSHKWRFCKSGNLVHKFGSYKLSIDRKTRKACFMVVTEKKKQRRNRRFGKRKQRSTTVCSDDEIPLDQWVHIAGIYDGATLKIVVNCDMQQDQKQFSGDISIKGFAPLFLGGQGLFAKLEETRISKVARSQSDLNCDPNGEPNETIVKTVHRRFAYSGWRVIEETEQTAEVGQPLGQEVVTRQYVDGAGIDEHLQMVVYDEAGTSIASERHFHENHRGDIVALTDEVGSTITLIEYSTYGIPFVVSDTGDLEEFRDFDEIPYLFQSRRVDSETSGLQYFRHRFYNPKLGRFLQRDPLSYAGGGMGLYEAFGANSYNYKDALGLTRYSVNNSEYIESFTLENERKVVRGSSKTYYGGPINFSVKLKKELPCGHLEVKQYVQQAIVKDGEITLYFKEYTPGKKTFFDYDYSPYDSRLASGMSRQEAMYSEGSLVPGAVENTGQTARWLDPAGIDEDNFTTTSKTILLYFKTRLYHVCGKTKKLLLEIYWYFTIKRDSNSVTTKAVVMRHSSRRMTYADTNLGESLGFSEEEINYQPLTRKVK